MVLMTLESHKATFLAMNSQRSDGTLCDVRLMVEDGHVLAHKAVLAATCPYFNTMFNGGFMEGGLSMTEINMSEVFPDLGTAERIIESMYTDQLDVTKDNICTLYSVCSFLLFNKPIQLCEEFMTDHLSLETCIEYWQATNYHNMSGELHSSITKLLMSRFHDHIIYQDGTLDMPLSTVSGLLKSKIAKFCSPKQILEFLVNWFVKSDSTEPGMFKKLLVDVELPIKDNLSQLVGIRESLAAKGTAKQTIQEICDDLYATFGVPNSGKDLVSEKVGHSGVKEGKQESRIDNPSQQVDMKMKDLILESCDREQQRSGKDVEGGSAKHARKEKLKQVKGKSSQVAVDVDDKEVTVRSTCSSKQKERPGLGKGLKSQGNNPSRSNPSGDSNVSSGPGDTTNIGDNTTTSNWTNDGLSSHLFSDLLNTAHNIDAILAIAPSLTCAQGNHNEYRKLRLVAYLLQPELWVELCMTEYPRLDNGDAISVAKSGLFAVGENVYLLSGIQLFSLCLTSNEWKKVSMPNKDYSDRRIFPLPLNGSLFLVIIDFAALEEEESMIYNKVLLWKVNGDGACEEILEHKEDFESRDKSIFGPCWVEGSSFFVNRSYTDGFGFASKGDILQLDPEKKVIKCIWYESDVVKTIGYHVGEKPFLLECDGWFYFWGGPTVFPSSSGESLQGCQMSEDKSKVIFEKKVVQFPDSLCFKQKATFIRSLTMMEVNPSSRMITTAGSRLWCLTGSDTSKPESCLQELCLQTPDVLKELAPPPCNVILAVTTASLDSAVLSTKPLARYHHVEDPKSEKKDITLLPDEYDEYDDYDMDYDYDDYDDYDADYDVDYDDYDVDYNVDYEVDYDDYDVWDPQEDDHHNNVD